MPPRPEMNVVAVDRRLLDVLVATERVEVVRLVVVQRCLIAEAPKRRIGIGCDLDVVGVVVDVALLSGAHVRFLWWFVGL